MSTKDREELIKFITGRAVEYIEMPRSDRKKQRSLTKESWGYRWFGMIPFAIRMWWNKKRLKK